jgi:hypothetical protein
METVLHHWPTLIFVPAVLVLITTLAIITRITDKE